MGPVVAVQVFTFPLCLKQNLLKKQPGRRMCLLYEHKMDMGVWRRVAVVSVTLIWYLHWVLIARKILIYSDVVTICKAHFTL